MKLSELMEYSEADVLKTPALLISLLRHYSRDFNNSKPVRTCERFLSGYYKKLKILNEMKKNRTCEPNIKGLLFVTELQTHLSNDNITDVIAVRLLKKGILKESHFTKLPEAWEKAKTYAKKKIKNADIK